MGGLQLYFFIADGRDTSDWKYLWDYEGSDNFVAEFDNWLYPSSMWGSIEILSWLPGVLSEESMQKLLEDVGISDENELINYEIPDEWWNYIHEYDNFGPRDSDLQALFLMTYGRLRYPYKLTKEIRENCELYVRGFVKIYNLIGEFTAQTKDPKEIAELFNFCVSVFPDGESFRESYITKKNIKELVLCDPEIFTAIADFILSKENIDRFLDEAHAQNKPELKLFLLDYENQHFPVDGQLL